VHEMFSKKSVTGLSDKNF